MLHKVKYRPVQFRCATFHYLDNKQLNQLPICFFANKLEINCERIFFYIFPVLRELKLFSMEKRIKVTAPACYFEVSHPAL